MCVKFIKPYSETYNATHVVDDEFHRERHHDRDAVPGVLPALVARRGPSGGPSLDLLWVGGWSSSGGCAAG